MGYREAACERPQPHIHLDGTEYDVDYFGMDDGRADRPDAAFRFIFQLGRGFMIYLYVIQAGGRREGRDVHGHFMHTFWTKDCAVAEVEMEEHGAPGAVSAAPMSLPLNYTQVTVRAEDGSERSSKILGQQFSAGSADDLTMEFTLTRGARLLWTRARAWEFEPAGGPLLRIEDSRRLLFSPPAEP